MITAEQLYKRQTTLTEMGQNGQQKLMQTKVVIMGCGGLGSAAAVYLAASGIGQLNLVDFDKVSVSNLHRQVFFRTKDIGKAKVLVLAKHVRAINPLVKVTSTNKSISKSNIFSLIEDADFIVDCTDSLIIKYLINDACVIKGKPLIYGSLYKFDGYVASFNIKQEDQTYSSNLRDAFPDISKTAIPNCSEVGTLNSIVGLIAMLQANEVIKLAANIGQALINKLLIYNSLDNTQLLVKLTPSKTASKAGQQATLKRFKDEAYFDPTCQPQEEALLIEATELRRRLLHGEASQKLKLISVIEDSQTTLPFEVHQKIPLSTLDLDKLDFNKNNEYIIVCQRGISSYTTTKLIKEKHPNLKVLSLKNGIVNY